MESDECHVCHKRGDRTGRHYGAVTCNSCRAFFRRVRVIKKPHKCKLDSSCPVDQTTKQLCPGCRYQKCVRVGMQLDLVLNEEEIKERFKISRNHNIHLFPSDKTVDSNTADTQSKSSQSFCSIGMIPTNSDPRSQIMLLPMLKSTVGLFSIQSQPQNPSKTPIIIKPKILLPTVEVPSAGQNIVPTSADTHCNREEGRVWDMDNTKQTSLAIMRKPEDIVVHGSEVITDAVAPDEIVRISQELPIDVIKKCRNSVIKKLEEAKKAIAADKEIEVLVLQNGTLDNEENEESSEDEIILMYLHKKFGNINIKVTDSLKSPRNEQQSPTENKSNSSTNLFIENRKRKSVITVHCTKRKMLYIRDDSIEVSKEGIRCFFEIDKVDFKTNDSVNSKFLDIMKQEYLNNLKQSFEITRNQVNTGQKMMEMYINFCKTRENFSPKIFESGRRALRERCLKFVCSLNIIDDLPMKTVYRMFKDNLNKTGMLFDVILFNASSIGKEIDFVQGTIDKKQWAARNPSIEGVGYNTMMMYLQLTEQKKVELYGELFASCMPIFQDRSVIVLMVLIIIFDQESSEDIRMFKQRFITILRSYLEKNAHYDVFLDMQNIVKCIQRLSELLRIFTA